MVEWLNVSFQVDVDPDYLYESQELLKQGYAWVGVSAQQLGVQGPLGLKQWDPKRYHALHHPGDTFSYSIFSQAAKSLIDPLGAHPLGSLRPRLLLADGESQSAFRMVTYANAIQPLNHLFGGFLIHSRGASGAPISQAPQAAPAMPPVARIRADLGVPTLTVETETDILPTGSATFRRPSRIPSSSGCGRCQEHRTSIRPSSAWPRPRCSATSRSIPSCRARTCPTRARSVM